MRLGSYKMWYLCTLPNTTVWMQFRMTGLRQFTTVTGQFRNQPVPLVARSRTPSANSTLPIRGRFQTGDIGLVPAIEPAANGGLVVSLTHMLASPR
jgi:hypothetical protein